MIKIKHLFVAVLVSSIIFSCKDDDKRTSTPFDYKKQAKMDNDSIVKFLKNHYYDTDKEEVKILISGKTALFNDEKLKTKEVENNDLKYNLYYYITNEGIGESPSEKDSVLVNYRGLRIVNSKLGSSFDENELIWLKLTEVIKGWTHAFPEFKAGQNATQLNEKITYEGYGKGILFIPSGLAYGNTRKLIVPNQNILFYIDLLDINKSKKK